MVPVFNCLLYACILMVKEIVAYDNTHSSSGRLTVINDSTASSNQSRRLSADDNFFESDIYKEGVKDYRKLRNTYEIAKLTKDIVNLNKRILSGGETAKIALEELHRLLSNKNAALIMRKLKTNAACSMLIKRETTPDMTRHLALSLISHLTDTPHYFYFVSKPTSSYYHMNVSVPSSLRNFQKIDLARSTNEYTHLGTYSDWLDYVA